LPGLEGFKLFSVERLFIAGTVNYCNLKEAKPSRMRAAYSYIKVWLVLNKAVPVDD
jgi:hypothetical protein